MFITNCKIKYFIVILVINSTIIQITFAEKPPNFCDYYWITKNGWIYKRKEKSQFSNY